MTERKDNNVWKIVGGVALIIGALGLGALLIFSSSPKHGDTKTLTLPGGATMEMIYVGPCSFIMGSRESEDGRDNDETQHSVTLTKGYWLGKYEVTLVWQGLLQEQSFG